MRITKLGPEPDVAPVPAAVRLSPVEREAERERRERARKRPRPTPKAPPQEPGHVDVLA